MASYTKINHPVYTYPCLQLSHFTSLICTACFLWHIYSIDYFLRVSARTILRLIMLLWVFGVLVAVYGAVKKPSRMWESRMKQSCLRAVTLRRPFRWMPYGMTVPFKRFTNRDIVLRWTFIALAMILWLVLFRSMRVASWRWWCVKLAICMDVCNQQKITDKNGIMFVAQSGYGALWTVLKYIKNRFCECWICRSVLRWHSNRVHSNRVNNW